MHVTLNGKTYYVALDPASRNRRQVLVQQSARMWRLASPQDSLRVLAGLSLYPLRLVGAP
jgi:hypothetical protein